MSKPEDVTDEAWGRAEIAAKEATRDAMRDPLMPYYITVTPYIARAIMSAEKRGEERERAACAVVADERGAICADAVAKIKAGELYRGIETAAASESCARLEAAHIAALIRARSA